MDGELPQRPYDFMTQSDFTPPEVDDLNEQLPSFEFVSRLAADDCKAVYLAKQKSLDRRAAIKIYSPAQSASQEFREDFAAKTKVMAKLKHPNLIGVYDSGYENGMVYLVSEFVAGKPMWNSTKGESIHIKHVQPLCEGICVGMVHAHTNKICHGALSLKNILLDETRMPKIGGFAQASGDTSKLDPSALRFRAPEMAEDGAKPTPQCDVYSIGVILREMAVGQTEGVEALGELEKVGPDLKRLVEKATSPDPSKRHRTVEEFYEEMLDAFDPDTVKKPAAGMLNTGAVKLPAAGAKPAAAMLNTGAVKLPAAGGKAGGPQAAGRASNLGKPGVGPAGGPGAKPAPMAPVKASSPNRLWLHLIIIVVLLVAIRVVWKAYNDKKEATQSTEQATGISPGHEVRVIRKNRPNSNNQQRPRNRPSDNPGPIDDFPNDPAIPQDTGPSSDEIAAMMERLRPDLARGSRGQMPKGTLEKNGHYFYHVNIPMTWRDAFWYAMIHGGHLAIPGSKVTTEWLRDEVAVGGEDPFWVGAAKSGRHAWTTVDGRAWRPKDPAVSSGEFVAVGMEGQLVGVKGPTERPFVIQWTRNGTNPGALAALLKITRESLATSSPIYPPGTHSYGIRNYLYVPQPLNWKDAVINARSSGGDLMVIGGIAEKFNAEKITKNIKAEEGIWLGGFHLPGEGWRWTTKEAWRSTEWPQNKPVQSPDVALLMTTDGEWQERARDSKASGYIIEWSPDAKSAAK